MSIKENEILEQFGKDLIETCFDMPFSFFEFFKDNKSKVTEDRFYNMKYYKEIMPNDLEVYSIVHQTIMTSAVSSLLSYLDNNQEYRLIHTDPNSNKKTDVLSLSVGSGELHEPNGWISKYSKYKHLLKLDLYAPK